MMPALSIRGPWWWFLLSEHNWRKDVENRTWPAPKELIGRNVLIHAAKTMSKKDFDDACAFALKAGATLLPRYDTLERGGIVGVARLVKCVRISTSRWWTGPLGHLFEDPYPLPFRPCIGQTGYFQPQFLDSPVNQTTQQTYVPKTQ